MRSFTKIIALVVLTGANLFAQANEEMIKWTLSVDPAAVKTGSNFEAKLTAKLGDGWHLYSISQPAGGPIATSIKVKDGLPFKFSDRIKAAPPIKNYDNNFRMETEFYQDEAEFLLPISTTAGATNSSNLIVEVTFQLCNDESCLPPTTMEVSTSSMVQTVNLPKPPNTIKSSNLVIGDVVTDFAFTDFEGKSRKFSEFKGKIVLLDFWATWCGPCLADIPKLKKIHEKYKAEGFEILGLNAETIGDEDPDPAFAKEAAKRAVQIVTTRGVTWPQANSATSLPVAVNNFGVKALPTKIIIGRDGKIIARLGEKDDTEKIVADAMAVKP